MFATGLRIPPPSSRARAGDPPEGAKTLSFKLTDAGCDPHNAEAPAGPINFEVENAGSPTVTELEVLDGETVLGEKENLTEGLGGNFVSDPRKGRIHARLQRRLRRRGHADGDREAAGGQQPPGERGGDRIQEVPRAERG